MTSYIYILSDGANTKIGKTISFEKRMASYNTHNANFELIKKYPCSESEATRVESFIKNIFKEHLVGKGKEWFAVPPSEIESYVSILLFKPSASNTRPSSHGVPLTEEAYQLQEEIILSFKERSADSKNVQRNKAKELRDAYYYYLDSNQIKKADAIKAEYEKISKEIYSDYYNSVVSKKEQLASLFASKFQLGIPEHKLPFDEIVIKDSFGVDIEHSKLQKESVSTFVKSNCVEIPFQDHCYRFFHLYKLPTGYYFAFCSAIASMPYIENLTQENLNKIFEVANDVGWHATVHNEWSWHSPKKTGLVLFEQKTPISQKINLFEKSFRRWVIENKVTLLQNNFENKEVLKDCIDDICHDNTFPLDVNSIEELCKKYLTIFWGITPENEFDLLDLGIDWRVEAYKHLFDKWKNENKH